MPGMKVYLLIAHWDNKLNDIILLNINEHTVFTGISSLILEYHSKIKD